MKVLLSLVAVVTVALAAPLDPPLDLSDPKVTAPVGDIQLNNLTFFRPFGFSGNVNGGQGGSTFICWDAWRLREALERNERRIVVVRGRIDLIVLFEDTPGVRLNVGSDTTVTGGDSNAEIIGGGLLIADDVRNIIVENIQFYNALSFAPGERPDGNHGIVYVHPYDFSEIDNIEITRGAENVWVNHCEFADDPWSPGMLPQRRHDGLIDIVEGASFVTVSNSIFRNHNHVTLIGNDDALGPIDSGRLKSTLFGNWYIGTGQRNPRVRFGEVHVLNNLYNNVGIGYSDGYAVAVGSGGSVFVERNVFLNSPRSWAFAPGVANPPGQLMVEDNILDENSGFDDGIPNDVTWHPNQYYSYTPIEVNDVEAHVRKYAGIW